MNQKISPNLMNKLGEYVPHLVYLQDQRPIDLTQKYFTLSMQENFLKLYFSTQEILKEGRENIFQLLNLCNCKTLETIT